MVQLQNPVVLSKDVLAAELDRMDLTQQGVIAMMAELPPNGETGVPMAVEVGKSYLSDFRRQRVSDPEDEKLMGLREARAFCEIAGISLDYFARLTNDRTPYYKRKIVPVEVDDEDERDILVMVLSALSKMPRDAQRAFAVAMDKMVRS